MSDKPTFHYVLIEQCDHSQLYSIRSFPTEKAREEATLLQLDGWERDDQQKVLNELAEDGIAEFEGDPPLRWMTATEFKVCDPAASAAQTISFDAWVKGDLWRPADCMNDAYASQKGFAKARLFKKPPAPAAPGGEQKKPLGEPKYLGDFSSTPPQYSRGMYCAHCHVSWTGCWDNFMCPQCGEGELPSCDPQKALDKCLFPDLGQSLEDAGAKPSPPAGGGEKPTLEEGLATWSHADLVKSLANMLRDTSEDEIEISKLAAKVLPQDWIDGDSHYVPNAVAIVEMLVSRLTPATPPPAATPPKDWPVIRAKDANPECLVVPWIEAQEVARQRDELQRIESDKAKPEKLERWIHEVRLAAAHNAFSIEKATWLAEICALALRAAELERESAGLREALTLLRELTGIIDAHEIDLMDCDRRGHLHCDCLERHMKKVREHLKSALAGGEEGRP